MFSKNLVIHHQIPSIFRNNTNNWTYIYFTLFFFVLRTLFWLDKFISSKIHAQVLNLIINSKVKRWIPWISAIDNSCCIWDVLIYFIHLTIEIIGIFNLLNFEKLFILNIKVWTAFALMSWGSMQRLLAITVGYDNWFIILVFIPICFLTTYRLFQSLSGVISYSIICDTHAEIVCISSVSKKFSLASHLLFLHFSFSSCNLFWNLTSWSDIPKSRVFLRDDWVLTCQVLIRIVVTNTRNSELRV